jgi:hypothetical protein
MGLAKLTLCPTAVVQITIKEVSVVDMNEVFNYITAAQQHTGGAFRETPREALQVRERGVLAVHVTSACVAAAEDGCVISPATSPL